MKEEPFWKRQEAQIKALIDHHRYRAKGSPEDRATREHAAFAELAEDMFGELIALSAQYNGLTIYHDEYVQKRATYEAEERGR